LGLNAHPYAHTKLKQLNLCTKRRRRQMSLPDGSIANLSVTRKSVERQEMAHALSRRPPAPIRTPLPALALQTRE
jgi:hypothetical protein